MTEKEKEELEELHNVIKKATRIINNIMTKDKEKTKKILLENDKKQDC